MRILSAARALPEHYYNQTELMEAFMGVWGKQLRNPARLLRFHKHVLVDGRHLALPMEDYYRLETFTQKNDAYIQAAVDLGESAIAGALEKASLSAHDIDHLFFVSVTGIATPSVDALLANRMRLGANMKRTPIFGLGCVAGAAGVARAADYLRGHADDVVVLLSVELCSLTLQREDISIANIISSGLFGDGAGAVVMAGRHHARPGLEVVASRSVFYPDTEQVMGWHVTSDGFKVVLSKDVATMVTNHLREDVDAFLMSHGLSRSDISRWICHTGGPRILEAYEEALEVPREAFSITWDHLAKLGNLSSASVLLVLEDTMEMDPPPRGSYGLMIAMGPGFCSELVLLKW